MSYNYYGGNGQELYRPGSYNGDLYRNDSRSSQSLYAPSSSNEIKVRTTNKNASFTFKGPDDSRFADRAFDIAERMTRK
jgi:hypothetical protein